MNKVCFLGEVCSFSDDVLFYKICVYEENYFCEVVCLIDEVYIFIKVCNNNNFLNFEESIYIDNLELIGELERVNEV